MPVEKLDALVELMVNISLHAAASTSLDVAQMFRGMGHIGEVRNEVRDYAAASLLPGVRIICEVGFNAGHSAAVFLSTNAQARYIGFDLGNLAWSSAQREYIEQMFPGRTTFVVGDSHRTIRKHREEHPEDRCDLWSIDGDHSAAAAIDFEEGRLMSSTDERGLAYVLADDCTDSFPAVKQVWHEQQVRNSLTSLYCHHENVHYNGYEKGWCLGRWLTVGTVTPAPISALTSRNVLAWRFNRLRDENCSHGSVPPEALRAASNYLSPDCRFLVYTAVSSDRAFNELVQTLVKTVYAVAMRHPSRCVVRTLIMTDEANAVETFADLRVKYGVEFHYFPFTTDPMRASMEKLKIYEVAHVGEYSAVLFLDADSIINLPNFDTIFLRVFLEPEKLHVYAEPRSSFEGYFWSLNNARFNASELHALAVEGIVPFNAGVFLFVPNAVILEQFRRLVEFIAHYNGDYFYEQAFLNYWFPRYRLVAYTIEDSLYTFPFFDENTVYRTIIHFAGRPVDSKVRDIRAYVEKHMRWMEQYVE
jgi:hypothetical protein